MFVSGFLHPLSLLFQLYVLLFGHTHGQQVEVFPEPEMEPAPHRGNQSHRGEKAGALTLLVVGFLLLLLLLLLFFGVFLGGVVFLFLFCFVFWLLWGKYLKFFDVLLFTDSISEAQS